MTWFKGHSGSPRNVKDYLTFQSCDGEEEGAATLAIRTARITGAGQEYPTHRRGTAGDWPGWVGEGISCRMIPFKGANVGKRWMITTAFVFVSLSAWEAIGAAGGAPDVDYRSLLSQTDLHYDRPVARSEEGMPIGNGRMGTLVWTMPEALRLQINRVDVFGIGCASNSFPERNSDYCGGCGFVDLDFGVSADDVFPAEATTQHLSCYDGVATVQGRGVKIQALASRDQDVIALRVEDLRPKPDPIGVALRMLRPARVRTRSHEAESKLEAREGRIALTQRFEEDEFFCGSAVVIGVVGLDVRVRQIHEEELRLVARPGSGAFTVFIASAASLDRNAALLAAALAQLDAAAAKGFDGLLDSNATWWHNFWARSFVQLHSEDGVADMIARNYAYYLYVMAASSRGTYPPKFNGMLWITGGDTRRWGGHYWGANQGCLYNGLMPANRLELMDPMFDMYSGMYDSLALAARQQWGSRGIWIPETVAFDGLAPLPEEIAAEMRELYLLQKPWEEPSASFREFAVTKLPFSSRWNWMGGGRWVDGLWRPTERGGGPYGPVTHIFSRGAKIAYQYWQRYEYTMDKGWLRDRAYPMLKGMAEFYRNYPNLKKAEDGKYHIYHVNSNESVWGGRDTDEEIASMRGILPPLIRASEILDLDAGMRPVWREFLANLAPLPRSDNPEASSSSLSQPNAPATWIRALPPIVRGRAGRPDGNTMPIWFFDLCTLENDDPDTMKIAHATYDAYFRNGVTAKTRVGVLSKMAVTAAMMGRADHVRYLLPNQIQSAETGVLANRMDLREGTQTTSVQRLGRAADALHNALCQSVPARPGEPPVIRVFPAWPREWDAAFTLLARGAFLVSASMTKGQIAFVQIQSQAGGECRLHNPWPDQPVTLVRNGNKPEALAGPLLRFPTAQGETLHIRPARPSH